MSGCSGLSLDAHDPHTLIAGMWQVEMHTWGEYSGGPGSGIYVSHDGGTTWKRLEEHGLPHAPVGKIDVAIAPTNSNRIYALMQTKDQGSVWRSDDAGEHWKAVNSQRALIGRAGYYIRLAVSTGSDNEVYVANSSFHQSLGCGREFPRGPLGRRHPRHLGRSGQSRSLRHHRRRRHDHHDGSRPRLPPRHAAHRPDVPRRRGRSDSVLLLQQHAGRREHARPERAAGFRRKTGWDRHMGGCESGFTVPDTADPNIVWATCYGNTVTRWDARYKEPHSVSPWKHTLDSPPNELKYRCHWTPPLAIDPFDHNTVYYGCQVIFRTTNAGQTWSVVSPDLSTQDPAHIAPSGGIVGDNLGQFYGEVVFAIAPSKIQKGLIWAGTNDGQLWYTQDAAAHWINVTSHLTGLPAARHRLPASRRRASMPAPPTSASICTSWTTATRSSSRPRISARPGSESAAICRSMRLSYVRSVADDPNCAGLLFAGTGNGLYYSLDEGGHWTALQDGSARRARDLGGGAAAVSRSGGFDLRPRALHPRRHHAAGADGQASLGCSRSSCSSRGRRIASCAAPQAMLNFSLKTVPKEYR